MAGLTLTIGALTKTYTISAADLARIVTALGNQYGPVGIGNGQTRPMNNSEIFAEWSAGIFASLSAIVLTTETATAQAAIVTPTPIAAS